jgi:hypothetical protein
MNKATLAVIAALSASLALGDDFKTVAGKEYKNATVSRVESDGIVIKFHGGIAKIFFVELPKAVQERFHYDAKKSAVSSGTPLPIPQSGFTPNLKTRWDAVRRKLLRSHL